MSRGMLEGWAREYEVLGDGKQQLIASNLGTFFSKHPNPDPRQTCSIQTPLMIGQEAATDSQLKCEANLPAASRYEPPLTFLVYTALQAKYTQEINMMDSDEDDIYPDQDDVYGQRQGGEVNMNDAEDGEEEGEEVEEDDEVGPPIDTRVRNGLTVFQDDVDFIIDAKDDPKPSPNSKSTAQAQRPVGLSQSATSWLPSS